MNPVPRPLVFTAAAALAGVSVLGLYLGIQPSLERAADAGQAAAVSTAPTAMKPGMAAAVEATPLKTDVLPPSAAPASAAPAVLAQAGRLKARDSADDEAPASDRPADSGAGRKAAAPEPPTLYAPDEPPAPPPANQNSPNTPPY